MIMNRSLETANILNALKETPSSRPGENLTKTSVKRSSDSSISFSRSNRVQENGDTFSNPSKEPKLSQPRMQLNLTINRTNRSSTSSAADWRVCKTAEGVEYYYNQRTRATTYDKPDVLKSQAELSLKVWIVKNDSK